MSTTSVIVVVAAVALATRLSKFPPVAVAIVRVTFTGVPAYTSFGTATVVEPLEAPPAIVIVAPLSSVTVTGWPASAGLFKLAVYVIVPLSATLALAVRLTVVVSTSSATLVNTVPVVATFSKFPPVFPVIDTLRFCAPCRYASSERTGTSTNPLV